MTTEKREELIEAAEWILDRLGVEANDQRLKGCSQELREIFWDLHDKKTSAEKLQCDARSNCPDVVTHIDEKGFIYCAKHGVDRRGYPGGFHNRRCRKLRPHEVKRLQRGVVVNKY